VCTTAVATVGPASGTTFTLTAIGAGNAAITFADANGRSAQVSVTVTITTGVIGLSGRPRHVPPGKDVHVEMIDGLATVGTRIEDEPVAVAAALAAELRRDLDELCEHGAFVGIGEFPDVRMVLDRHHEQMHRRLGIDVFDREHRIVAIDGLRGNLTRGDLTEQTVHRYSPNE
jgi:hypothetical protein